MKRPSYKIETQKLASGYTHVIGCDEVGRGCLAGPVVAAAVILNPDLVRDRKRTWYKQVRDSKLVLPAKRSRLAELIKEESLAWGIGMVSHAQVDRLNIHYASLLAMHKAVTGFKKVLERFDPHGTECRPCVLVDGKFVIRNLDYEQQAIVDGDASVLSIAAASILAKTYRDNLMVKLHKKFPDYDFPRHKGYATKAHWSAVRHYGLSPVLRLTFCGNIG